MTKSSAPMSNTWVAWYPVRTVDKKWVWLRGVVRVWDPHYDLQVVDVYDPGEWVGGWRYYLIEVSKHDVV